MWNKKKKLENNTAIAVDYSRLNLNDSEKLIVAIGAKIETAVPDVMKDEGDDSLKGRKLMKIASEILSGLIIGNDSFGLKEIPFNLLIKEYKRLKKKATRPDSPANHVHKIS